MNNASKLSNQDLSISIFEVIEDIFDVDKLMLSTKCRARELVYIRNAAMYILWKQRRMSKSSIARLFNRNHTTCLYAIACVKDARKGYNAELLSYYNMLNKVLILNELI